MSEAPPPLALGHEAAPDNPMGRLQDVHRTSSTLQLPGSAGSFFHEPPSQGDTTLQSSTATPSLLGRSSFTQSMTIFSAPFRGKTHRTSKVPIHFIGITMPLIKIVSQLCMPSHTSQWDPSVLTSMYYPRHRFKPNLRYGQVKSRNVSLDRNVFYERSIVPRRFTVASESLQRHCRTECSICVRPYCLVGPICLAILIIDTQEGPMSTSLGTFGEFCQRCRSISGPV